MSLPVIPDPFDPDPSGRPNQGRAAFFDKCGRQITQTQAFLNITAETPEIVYMMKSNAKLYIFNEEAGSLNDYPIKDFGCYRNSTPILKTYTGRPLQDADFGRLTHPDHSINSATQVPKAIFTAIKNIYNQLTHDWDGRKPYDTHPQGGGVPYLYANEGVPCIVEGFQGYQVYGSNGNVVCIHDWVDDRPDIPKQPLPTHPGVPDFTLCTYIGRDGRQAQGWVRENQCVNPNEVTLNHITVTRPEVSTFQDLEGVSCTHWPDKRPGVFQSGICTPKLEPIHPDDEPCTTQNGELGTYLSGMCILPYKPYIPLDGKPCTTEDGRYGTYLNGMCLLPYSRPINPDSNRKQIGKKEPFDFLPDCSCP